MNRRTLFWSLGCGLLSLVVCVPAVSFVAVNLKSGYDDAEKRPKSAAKTTSSEPPTPTKPGAVDFGKLDLSKNTTGVGDRSTHFVSDLPALHGTAHDGARDGMVGQGQFEVNGTIASMTGAVLNHLPSSSHSGGKVALEVSVERGTLRAYLGGLDGAVVSGYVWVEASPDKPGRVIGYLQDWSATSNPEQTFVLEARDAEVRGVTYRVARSD